MTAKEAREISEQYNVEDLIERSIKYAHEQILRAAKKANSPLI